MEGLEGSYRNSLVRVGHGGGELGWWWRAAGDSGKVLNTSAVCRCIQSTIPLLTHGTGISQTTAPSSTSNIRDFSNTQGPHLSPGGTECEGTGKATSYAIDICKNPHFGQDEDSDIHLSCTLHFPSDPCRSALSIGF